jgi:hypothetical protein
MRRLSKERNFHTKMEPVKAEPPEAPTPMVSGPATSHHVLPPQQRQRSFTAHAPRPSQGHLNLSRAMYDTPHAARCTGCIRWA